MHHLRSFFGWTFLWIALLLGGMHYTHAQQLVFDPNPAAAGFNVEASDPRAVLLADTVMAAMGGRVAWDETRYLHWNFFGRRTLLWDKWTGQVRIDIPAEEAVYLVNIQDGSGKIMRGGAAVTQPDSLRKYLEQAKNIWINDSYWLCMPFKLKDSGVTLRYLGVGETQDSAAAQILELTFAEVGVTPDNKYLVWVDAETHLVSQWAYYTRYDDPNPRLRTPWGQYQRHGQILLSGHRGQGQLTDLAVYQTVPVQAFTEFVAPDPAMFSR